MKRLFDDYGMIIVPLAAMFVFGVLFWNSDMFQEALLNQQLNTLTKTWLCQCMAQ